jgi:hypothetical protein
MEGTKMEGFTDALIEWLEEKITDAKKELKNHSTLADQRPRLEQREQLLLELLAEVKAPKTFEVYSDCSTTFYWNVTARNLPEAIAQIKEKLERDAGEIEGCDDVTYPDQEEVISNLNGWEAK